MKHTPPIYFLLILKLVQTNMASPEEPHSRQKRLLWVTADGRLALPPGTTLVISPSLSIPFVRYPPDGFFSNLTISLPFTIDFNKLGLTDNENPFGAPLYMARSMGRAAGSLLADYIGAFIQHRRGKRETQRPPELPPEYQNVLHGGERAILYSIVEDFLENFGMNGKACLLRAICEVHANPLTNYGFLGEIIKLFFTASKSPYYDIIEEYVEAENAGRGTSGASECWPYMKDCPKSLFKPTHKHYNSNTEEDKEVYGKKKITKVSYNPTRNNM